MRKLFTIMSCFALFAISTTVKAQSYKTAAGLAIDFGDGSTLVGPHIKHFFNANGAAEVDVLFGSGVTVIQALYLYHGNIKGAQGLRWDLGVGPGVAIGDNNTNFLVRPNAGLDYKISGAPLNVSFDWRPKWQFFDGGNDFSAGRFQIGFRYVFK